MNSRTGWGRKEWVGRYQPELARFFDFFHWDAKYKMLSPFLLSAVQRRLIPTPAEAPNLPPFSSAPTPYPHWPEDIVPRICLAPRALCVW